MAISLVQTTTGAASSTTLATSAFVSNTTTGNCIIVGIGYNGFAANNVSSITDSQSNTYVKIGNLSGSNQGVEIWYAKNITGGTTPTVTATFSSAPGNESIIAREYSGLDTVSPYDVSNFNTMASQGPGTDTNVSGFTAATAQGSELVVGVTQTNGHQNSSQATVGTGYGNFVQVFANPSSDASMEDEIVSSVGTQQATFSTPGASNPSASTGVATFKAAATGVPQEFLMFNSIGLQ